ncbi:hypothetical protein OPAG_04113 [Rhodococcus opacus PD630]|nr:hypothetical protein OPAG_04113 [Rhodococcus opacus PD630]
MGQAGSAGETTPSEPVRHRRACGTVLRRPGLDHLNPAMIDFLGRQELAFVAIADATGECDNSLRAGAPGFLHVIDSTTLAYPEYRGNGVMASLGNILENPHVGIMVVDFVDDLIGLHVNGSARIVEDEELCSHIPNLPADGGKGRTPISGCSSTSMRPTSTAASTFPG